MNYTSPAQLRKLADMIERGEAKVTGEYRIVDERHMGYDYLDSPPRRTDHLYRKSFDKTVNLEIEVLGPLEWQDPHTGKWEVVG